MKKLIFGFFVFPLLISAQEVPDLNSIKKRIASGHDTTRARAYLEWGSLVHLGQPDSALQLWNKSVKIAQEQLKNKNLSPQLTLTYKKIYSEAINGIGFSYSNLGNSAKSLECYQIALDLCAETNDKIGEAACLNNIGLIHINQGDTALTLSFYEKSLAINKMLNDKNGTAYCLNNISYVYKLQKKFTLALQYLTECLKMREESNDNRGIATALHNMGSLYEAQKNSEKALEYYFKALALREKINDRKGISYSAYGVAFNYFNTGNILLAKKYALQSFAEAQQIKFPANIISSSGLMSKIYASENDWKNAFKMLEIKMKIKDSVDVETNKKSVYKQQIKYEYEKKEAVMLTENQKAKELALVEQSAQRKVIYIVSSALMVVLILAIFIFRSYNHKKNAHVEITIQKQIIEDKQKEILDSIHYAKRIQESLLPSERYIERSLNRLNKN